MRLRQVAAGGLWFLVRFLSLLLQSNSPLGAHAYTIDAHKRHRGPEHDLRGARAHLGHAPAHHAPGSASTSRGTQMGEVTAAIDSESQERVPGAGQEAVQVSTGQGSSAESPVFPQVEFKSVMEGFYPVQYSDYSSSVLPADALISGISYKGGGMRMRQMLAKAKAGRPITIASLGGSGTVGDDSTPPEGLYPALVLQWFQSKFPGAEHRVLPLAQKDSTTRGVGYMRHCYWSHLPSDVDLILVEYSVYQDLPACRKGVGNPSQALYHFHNLLRALVTLPSSPAVLQINLFPFTLPLPLYYAAACEDRFEVVAKYYDVPSLSLRDALYRHLYPFGPPEASEPPAPRPPSSAFDPRALLRECGPGAGACAHITARGHAAVADLVRAYLAGLGPLPEPSEPLDIPPPMWHHWHPDFDLARTIHFPKEHWECVGSESAPEGGLDLSEAAPAEEPPNYYDSAPARYAGPVTGLHVNITLDKAAYREWAQTPRYSLGLEALDRGLTLRGDLPRFQKLLRKGEAGEPIVVAAVGGSVTKAGQTSLHFGEHSTYHGQVVEWLKKQFPESPIEYTNGAVGASNTDYMELCLGWHCPQQADLVFIEYAVNTIPSLNLDQPGDMKIIQSYERLVRKVLQLPGSPFVVLVNMFAFTVPLTRPEGVTFWFNTPEDQYNWVAKYYRLATVSMRDAVYNPMRARREGFDLACFMRDCAPEALRHSNPRECRHPNTIGHHYAGELIIHLLETLQVAHEREGSAAAEAALPAPMFASNPPAASQNHCWREHELQPLATASQGFEYVVEGSAANPKPGMVGYTAGAWIEFTVNTTVDPRTLADMNPHERAAGARVQVTFGWMKTYENIGAAALNCTNCACQVTQPDEFRAVEGGWLLNGHHSERFTGLDSVNVLAEANAQCTFRITVLGLAHSHTNSSKFKVTNVVMAERPGQVDNGFFTVAERESAFIQKKSGA